MRLHTTIHVSKISHGQHNNKIGSAESRQFKVTWQKKLNLKILLSRDNNWQEWKSDLQRINKYFQLLQLNSVTAAGNQSDTQCANDEWEGLDRTYRWRFVCVLLLQSCPTLCDSMDCSPSGSSVHGTLQARTQEWVAISYSSISSQSRDWTCVYYVSCIGKWVLYH